MTRTRRTFSLVAAFVLALAAFAPAAAFAETSDERNTTEWTGNGAENLPCDGDTHWIFNDGTVEDPILTVDGETYSPTKAAGAYHFYTGPTESVSDAFVTYTGDLRVGNDILTISSCDGVEDDDDDKDPKDPEEPAFAPAADATAKCPEGAQRGSIVVTLDNERSTDGDEQDATVEFVITIDGRTADTGTVAAGATDTRTFPAPDGDYDVVVTADGDTVFDQKVTVDCDVKGGDPAENPIALRAGAQCPDEDGTIVFRFTNTGDEAAKVTIAITDEHDDELRRGEFTLQSGAHRDGELTGLDDGTYTITYIVETRSDSFERVSETVVVDCDVEVGPEDPATNPVTVRSLVECPEPGESLVTFGFTNTADQDATIRAALLDENREVVRGPVTITIPANSADRFEYPGLEDGTYALGYVVTIGDDRWDREYHRFVVDCDVEVGPPGNGGETPPGNGGFTPPGPPPTTPPVTPPSVVLPEVIETPPTDVLPEVIEETPPTQPVVEVQPEVIEVQPDVTVSGPDVLGVTVEQQPEVQAVTTTVAAESLPRTGLPLGGLLVAGLLSLLTGVGLVRRA